MIAGKFDGSSRYAGLGTALHTDATGRQTRYLRRRFIPRPVAPEIGAHHVAEGDRIDRIAAASLGDPALWWCIADANRAVDPLETTDRIGRRLKIAIEDGTLGAGGGEGS